MRKRQPRAALNFCCAAGSYGVVTTKAARFSICGRIPLKPSEGRAFYCATRRSVGDSGPVSAIGRTGGGQRLRVLDRAPVRRRLASLDMIEPGGQSFELRLPILAVLVDPHSRLIDRPRIEPTSADATGPLLPHEPRFTSTWMCRETACSEIANGAANSDTSRSSPSSRSKMRAVPDRKSPRKPDRAPLAWAHSEPGGGWCEITQRRD
jgi:hypothetical protein